MRRGLETCDIHMEIERANEIENVTGGQVADVHQRVDDRERDRTLCGRGINSRRCQQNRCAERFTDRERQNAAHKRGPWNGGEDHDAPRDCANADAEEKSAAKSNRVR